MIVYSYPYYSPSCDICGHMLPAEKTKEAAKAARAANGWISRQYTDENGVEVWEDVCPFCQKYNRERKTPWNRKTGSTSEAL